MGTQKFYIPFGGLETVLSMFIKSIVTKQDPPPKKKKKKERHFGGWVGLFPSLVGETVGLCLWTFANTSKMQ